MLKKVIVSVFSLVVMAGAQVNVVLKSPPSIAPAVLAKQHVESFPIANFVNPATPLTLAHEPMFGTLVTVTLKGDTLLDQISVVKTTVPITVTVDIASQALASQVVVAYSSLD